MTGPAGFAQLFAGWNVWDVWQSQDQDETAIEAVENAGLSDERLVRIWVENWIKDNAPAAAVADPVNPLALRGAQVLVIPNAGGLEVLQTRADFPEFAGAQQLGEEGSAVKKWTVRFFNRGTETAVPWPHDRNHMLEHVYQPSASSPITSGEAPGSLAGSASAAAQGIGEALKVVAVLGGVGIAAWLLITIVNSNRRAAA